MSSSSSSSPYASSGSLVRFVVTAVVVACLAVPTTLVVAAGVVFWHSAVEGRVARGQQMAATTATLMAVARESGSAADLAVATAFVRAVISEDVEAVVVLDASQAVVTSAVGPRFADAAAAVQALGTSGVQSGGVVVDATIMERERGTEVQRPGGRVLVGLKRPSVPLRLMVGFAIVGVAAAAGMALVVVALLRRRALRPLSAVTRGLQAVAGGAVDAAAVAADQVRTPGQRPLKEIEALLDAFDALVRGEKERQRLVTRLEQGMGPQVAHDHQALERAPAQQEVAIVVVDVRDFTALQASLSPELAVGFVDRLLSTFVAVVERHGGHVERFLGDGLIALFGAPQPTLDYIARALACAVDLEVAARHLAESEKLRGVPRFVVGVGVAAGTATVGAVGPASRRSFAAMGEVPALARKIQQEAKNQGLTVLVGEGVYAAAKGAVPGLSWNKLPPMVLRGVGMPQSLYRPERIARANDDVTAVIGGAPRSS
jgi:class 3 adenylate cyclase